MWSMRLHIIVDSKQILVCVLAWKLLVISGRADLLVSNSCLSLNICIVKPGIDKLICTFNPQFLAASFLDDSFVDFYWLRHLGKDETKDYLGGTGAPNIDIHHHVCVVLKCVCLLVDQTQSIKDNQRNLHTSWQNHESPIQANESSISIQVWSSFDSISDPAHCNGKDSKRNNSAESIEPNGKLKFIKDCSNILTCLFVESSCEQNSWPNRN